MNVKLSVNIRYRMIELWQNNINMSWLKTTNTIPYSYVGIGFRTWRDLPTGVNTD